MRGWKRSGLDWTGQDWTDDLLMSCFSKWIFVREGELDLTRMDGFEYDMMGWDGMEWDR